MDISISFAEISEYVGRHYGQRLSLTQASDRELRVSFEKHIVIKTVTVGVNLRIEDVRPEGLTLSYNGGLGIDLIITGALVFLKTKVPELGDVLVSEEGHRIRLELSKLEKTRGLFEKMALKDIRVCKEGVTFSLSLK